MIIPELISIKHDLEAKRSVEPVTVRTFLWWFNAQRRGFQIVHEIRSQLSEIGIVTLPDFESTWIDGPIYFELESVVDQATQREEAKSGSHSADQAEDDSRVWVTRDATYRISKLAAANQGITSVPPGGNLEQAVTILLARDFSQLAVMSGEHTVKGMVSWKSIGSRLALVKTAPTVQNYMENHHEVQSNISIFDAIPFIRAHGYVLVRDEKNKITGIVTASDLSEQFQSLSEPFLLLSEIENLIRNMIGNKFSNEELGQARDPTASYKKIEDVGDLTFGGYIHLLQEPDRWSKLELAIDRQIFCKDLDVVREIRNSVTHFDPDGITPSELDKLRHFKSFLTQLEMLVK